jgi:hypothetical protein
MMQAVIIFQKQSRNLVEKGHQFAYIFDPAKFQTEYCNTSHRCYSLSHLLDIQTVFSSCVAVELFECNWNFFNFSLII